MRYFEGFAERREVRRVVDTSMEFDSVQGVVFQLDSNWLTAWRVFEALGPKQAESFFRHVGWYPLWDERRFLRAAGLSDKWIPLRVPQAEDVEKWRPPFWNEYQKEVTGREFNWPVIIKICLVPRGPNEILNVPQFEGETLNIVYETRPRARLFAGSTASHNPLIGGTSIGVGASDFGTLGGLLRDDAGKRYGVTCAHVATQGQDIFHPAQADDPKGARKIGTVVAHDGLRICPPGSPCSWRATAGYVNDLDVALIEVDAATTTKLEIFKIGAVTTIRPGVQLVQGMSVELTGRSKGHKTSLEFGGNGKFYRIPDGQGGEYCVRNTIELTEPSYYKNVFTSPVDEGDSGAWVCAPGANGAYDWCAIVIGGTGFTGIALEAETIRDWWSNPPHNLSLHLA